MTKTATYHTNVRWLREHWGQVAMGNGPEMEFSAPPDAHGHAGVLTPEDAFVGAADTCVMLMFLWAAERFRLKLVSYECRVEGTKRVELDRTEIFTRLLFRPVIHVAAGAEPKDAVEARTRRALAAAQKYSLVANSVKSEIVMEPEIVVETHGTRHDEELRTLVRNQYGRVAQEGGGVGCAPSCCGPAAISSERLGYEHGHLSAAPEGADLGLGCGNPHAIAGLRPGDIVLDLGCGGGLDCFIAAKQVGPSGHVIGVDMTPEMLARARANARKIGADNVEFRLGEIEHLPVADSAIDVILSNCVINLSPEKAAVFRDAFRVLKEGGRLAVSDIVQTAPMPASLRENAAALIGCVAGAVSVETTQDLLRRAGFEGVRVEVKCESRGFIRDWMPGSGAENYVASANITAHKPKRN